MPNKAAKYELTKNNCSIHTAKPKEQNEKYFIKNPKVRMTNRECQKKVSCNNCPIKAAKQNFTFEDCQIN